jgi:1-acyl-sn-glycerol-3-phosphate acyltransferase
MPRRAPRRHRLARLGREIRRIGGVLLGWALWGVITVVWGFVLAPLTLLVQPLWRAAPDHYAAFTRRILRLYVTHLPFARFEIEGAERRLTGPRILVLNHQSRLDSPVLLGLEAQSFGPIRGYMLRVPLVGRAIRLIGFFDADADLATLDAMNHAAARTRACDGALLFYPEGTRSKTGEIGPFRRGAFRAAYDHGLPIQPVVIEGLDVVLPPGRLLPPVYGRYPVRIRYLEPLQPPYGEGPRREVVRALTERVRDLLVDELARMREERRTGTRPCPKPSAADAAIVASRPS